MIVSTSKRVVVEAW